MNDDEAEVRLDNYLSHMMEAAHLARQYVQDVSKDGFLTDRTQQAVVLNLMTIGEASVTGRTRRSVSIKEDNWRIGWRRKRCGCGRESEQLVELLANLSER